MRGLVKRDLCLLQPMLKTYGILIAVMLGLSVVTKSSFLLMYVIILSVTTMTTLFSYDEANHWPAYAATLPNGRRDSVRARYATTLLLGGVSMVLTSLTGLVILLLGQGDVVAMVPLGLSFFFLCADFTLPITYKVGSNKARMLTMVVAMLAAALVVVAGLSLQTFSGKAYAPDWLLPTGLLALAVGLVGLFPSWKLSLRFVENRDY